MILIIGGLIGVAFFSGIGISVLADRYPTQTREFMNCMQPLKTAMEISILHL